MSFKDYFVLFFCFWFIDMHVNTLINIKVSVNDFLSLLFYKSIKIIFMYFIYSLWVMCVQFEHDTLSFYLCMCVRSNLATANRNRNTPSEG